MLVRSCICKGSENIVKNCTYEQITSSSSQIYLHQRGWQEFMTYRYKTRIRLTRNTGDRVSHMYDKAHAQQQQQRKVMQTLHRTARLTANAKVFLKRHDIGVYNRSRNPVQLCIDDNQIFQTFELVVSYFLNQFISNKFSKKWAPMEILYFNVSKDFWITYTQLKKLL